MGILSQVFENPGFQGPDNPDSGEIPDLRRGQAIYAVFL
jgi:hypothetical protein